MSMTVCCVPFRSAFRAVRLDHQIGSLAVGKQADLVLLNPDLTLDSVYVDGEKVR